MAQKWIIGIDEVGRGPLAGPITVAAVAIRKSHFRKLGVRLPDRDSKKLSPLQREIWAKKIRSLFPFTVVSVSSNIIDKRGISYAARIAVARSLQQLSSKLQLPNSSFSILLDGGLYAPREYKYQQTIIKGDELHPIISAASIIAKVHRDAYMTRLHKKFPQYGFARHKGYGTLTHRQAIEEHGLLEHHRVTFCKRISVQ